MGNGSSRDHAHHGIDEDPLDPFDGIDTLGYRVLGVQPHSPASDAGLVSFLDFLVGCNGKMLLGSGEELEPGDEYDDVDLPALLEENKGKELEFLVWNIKSQEARLVHLIPGDAWGGAGLLGVTIRLDNYGGAEDRLVRVLSVVTGGPAHACGLLPLEDYILGTTHETLESVDTLAHSVLAPNVDHVVELYVYNAQSDQVRTVALLPTYEWDDADSGVSGNGLLGAEVGTGYLHRLPSRARTTAGTCVSLKVRYVDQPNGTKDGSVTQVVEHEPQLEMEPSDVDDDGVESVSLETPPVTKRKVDVPVAATKQESEPSVILASNTVAPESATPTSVPTSERKYPSPNLDISTPANVVREPPPPPVTTPTSSRASPEQVKAAFGKPPPAQSSVQPLPYLKPPPQPQQGGSLLPPGPPQSSPTPASPGFAGRGEQQTQRSPLLNAPGPPKSSPTAASPRFGHIEQRQRSPVNGQQQQASPSRYGQPPQSPQYGQPRQSPPSMYGQGPPAPPIAHSQPPQQSFGQAYPHHQSAGQYQPQPPVYHALPAQPPHGPPTAPQAYSAPPTSHSPYGHSAASYHSHTPTTSYSSNSSSSLGPPPRSFQPGTPPQGSYGGGPLQQLQQAAAPPPPVYGSNGSRSNSFNPNSAPPQAFGYGDTGPPPTYSSYGGGVNHTMPPPPRFTAPPQR